MIGDNVDCVLRGGQITDQSLIARHVGDLQIGVVIHQLWNALALHAHPRELQILTIAWWDSCLFAHQ